MRKAHEILMIQPEYLLTITDEEMDKNYRHLRDKYKAENNQQALTQLKDAFLLLHEASKRALYYKNLKANRK